MRERRGREGEGKRREGRVGNGVSDWFEVKVGLQQGCDITMVI